MPGLRGLATGNSLQVTVTYVTVSRRRKEDQRIIGTNVGRIDSSVSSAGQGIAPPPPNPILCSSVRAAFKIFSTLLLCCRFLTYIEGKISRRINGTASLKRRAVECGHCSVPVDSLNVPKSTSRRFRHLLRSFFEVNKKKDSSKGSNKCILYGFYTNMFSSAHDAKTTPAE